MPELSAWCPGLSARVSREDALRLCREELLAFYTYEHLARLRLLPPRLRAFLEKAAENEYEHYALWRELGGECHNLSVKLRAWLTSFLAVLFGVTFVIRLLELKEDEAIAAYRALLDKVDDRRFERLVREEEVHERELAESLNESRIKYLGSLALGISDALVELTGIYAGSLGAMASTRAAGVVGLLAGVSASISMGAASYAQAKHEAGKDPRRAALYTLVAYLTVTVAMSSPYFALESPLAAFAAMLAVAFGAVAYMSLYARVLLGRSLRRELAENSLLILGVSLLLLLLGTIFREFLK